MFKITSGSVIGRSHIRLGINNQDAHAYHVCDDGFVAVVCDGCGSGAFSEVGATMGSKIITNMLRDFIKTYTLSARNKSHLLTDIEVFKKHAVLELCKIKRQLVSFITNTAAIMDADDFINMVIDHFLFTIVGAVSIYPFGVIFSIGDGCYALNEKLIMIPPCESNSPPYIAYNTIANHVKEEVLSRSANFEICEMFNTEDLDSLLIGTDGVMDIEEAAENRIPGKEELVGPVNQFWNNEKYTKNSTAITRRLTQIKRHHSRVKNGWLQHEQGHLSDDTTIILIKRVEDESISEG